MAHRLGLDAKLYYKVGGQAAGGAWVVIGNVRDLTLNMAKGEADVSTRANAGWRARAGTLKDATVEFDMVWDTADAGFTAIKNAYMNNEIIGFQVRDSVGGQGLQADFEILNFSRSEPLEEALSVSVTAAAAYSATPPSWIP